MNLKKQIMSHNNLQLTSIYESEIINRDQLAAGIDEAGRGPLAGPVVAAAVIFPIQLLEDTEFLHVGIYDSKKLNEKKRNYLAEIIKEKALAWSVSFVDNITIDKINILQASMAAMKNAVNELKVKPNFLLVDGNYFIGCNIPFKTIVGGDAKCISIAAASILAKTARDKWMIEVAAKKYPDYGFDKHKGYATKQHFEKINKYGICPLHRNTFLYKYLKRLSNDDKRLF